MIYNLFFLFIYSSEMRCDNTMPLQCCLLENHLEGAVVEGVTSHHPHDLLLHHGLMGRSGEGRAEGLDARQDPEGLSGRDS